MTRYPTQSHYPSTEQTSILLIPSATVGSNKYPYLVDSVEIQTHDLVHKVCFFYIFLLRLYILASSKVISGWTPTCDSAHSYQLHTAAPLREQSIGALTRYPTQSYYPDTELTSPRPTLAMLSARLGSDIC